MPGASKHSEKWDNCVKDVQKGGSADNAYAVCTKTVGREDPLIHHHGGDQGTAGSGHAGGMGHTGSTPDPDNDGD